MPSKARILLAKAADGLRLNGGARLFHHLGRPNFGDDLNPWFFGAVSGRPFRWGATGRSHVLGIGSIGDRATPLSWVLGSGFLLPAAPRPSGGFGRILALRGELSAEVVRETPPFLGDPACLLDRLVPRPALQPGRIGIVPHVTSLRLWREAMRGRSDLVLIDPSREPLSVIRAIAACERVASQSLHGLIVADAYGIPAVWAEPSEAMIGGRFKFDDHFTAMHEAREPVGLAAILGEPSSLPWAIGRLRADKAAYLAHLRASVEAFLASGD